MRLITAALVSLALTTAAQAQTCGGSFSAFVDGLRQEAAQRGHSQQSISAFFGGVQQDQATLRADRAQGIFTRPFVDFSRRLISQNRIDAGRRNAERYRTIFDRVEREYGVSRGVLLAFWAFETDFGAFQGDYNTVNSLVTLAHDCRRPQLFRPQVFAALRLFENGDLNPRSTTGAWAGEIGMVQMLPEDILERGVDGDGDGRVDLQNSAADALLSGANLLRELGWSADQPWLVEVTMPANFNWAETGLETTRRVSEWRRMGVQGRNGALPNTGLRGSIVLPQGRNGPAFMAYPNYSVLFEWNKSFVYVTTAAYFATRLEGAQVYNAGNPDAGLDGDQMRALQRRLVQLGHDVGGVDGILGARTRAAVQAEQERLGMPADAWPTPELLRRL
jgi:lytic murein transglycosylase